MFMTVFTKARNEQIKTRLRPSELRYHAVCHKDINVQREHPASIFRVEDGGSRFLRNVRVPIYKISIYLSGLVTAVAVFRNPNTIPFCLATDLLLNVLFSWLLVHFPSTFFLDVFFSRKYTYLYPRDHNTQIQSHDSLESPTKTIKLHLNKSTNQMQQFLRFITCRLTLR